MTPIAKNITVLDEAGRRLTSTYPKRANGLIKHGRARWIDETTLCLLACPSDDTEDTNMESTNDYSMHHADYSRESDGSAADAADVRAAQEGRISARDILQAISDMQHNVEHIQMAVDAIVNLQNTPTDSGAPDDQRPGAIARIVAAREENNHMMLEMLKQLYDDQRADARRAHGTPPML